MQIFLKNVNKDMGAIVKSIMKFTQKLVIALFSDTELQNSRNKISEINFSLHFDEQIVAHVVLLTSSE